ncbi:MAG: M20/M25/M40 family metallo-hydrolase [Candidatus Tectomicrobia bacterium]|uniref:M20/M25/M40 family metallo-hydrolase n=1 Tax=Tectimicrobiota bacterium TaxID=2528274 RepID=A0A937W745_UNCTE|nr:M20/M25/M40 family metallo-hydrolase [Candidatus Tectomicrobia bacterium]
MLTSQLTAHIDTFWAQEILPTLQDYIRIPNESPLFDPDWKAHGHMERAVALVADWIQRQGITGGSLQVLQDGDRTPVLILDFPGTIPDTILMYGHLDKQPPMVGWREDLGPWTPYLDAEGRLYGRGAGDDGYAVFTALATVKALKDHGQPHGRIIILIECSEESGSRDLPHYINTYSERLGTPSLIICLDSGCGNYDQLWSTTSLRGQLVCTLQVEVLREGVHSGLASGIVPNPFTIVRKLLDRLEDTDTGAVRVPDLHVPIPTERVQQAEKAAVVLGGAIVDDFPMLEAVHVLADNPVELLLNNAWRPALAVTGQDGMPSVTQAGNVLLPQLTYKLSLRLPPTMEAERATAVVQQLLETEPPFGARVTVTASGTNGWSAPPLAPWLAEVTDRSSEEFFGKEACYIGLGGSIPFMAMLGERFPQAQFLITGVLGPHANAHGPNEFLHTPYAKKLNCCLVRVVEAHYRQATAV